MTYAKTEIVTPVEIKLISAEYCAPRTIGDEEKWKVQVEIGIDGNFRESTTATYYVFKSDESTILEVFEGAIKQIKLTI